MTFSIADNLLRSVILALITSALWGIAPVLFKNTYSKLPPSFSYIFDGFIGGTLILLPFAIFQKDFDLNVFFKILPFTVLYSITYFMYIKAFQYGKAAVVCAVTQTFPIITVILSILYNYEPLNYLKIVAVIILIFLVMMLSYEENRIAKQKINLKKLIFKPWFLYALVTSFGIGFGDFYLNMGIDNLGTGNASFSIYATQLVISLAILSFTFKKTKRQIKNLSKKTYLYSIALGSIFMNLGAITLYRAFDLGLASIVSPVSSLSPVFTIIFAWAFLKEKMSNIEKILIVLITLIVAYIGM